MKIRSTQFTSCFCVKKIVSINKTTKININANNLKKHLTTKVHENWKNLKKKIHFEKIQLQFHLNRILDTFQDFSLQNKSNLKNKIK